MVPISRPDYGQGTDLYNQGEKGAVRAQARRRVPLNVEDVFPCLWPPISRYIRATNKDGLEHANLIRELQRAESSLVIGQVCERLRVHHPGMFVLSLHDALYSIEDNMAAITREFERAFSENGYRMSLKPG